MQPDHRGESALPRRILAKLHIAKKALGLDDEDWRDLLERMTGHRSARELTEEHLRPLQRELRRLGWDGWLLRRDEVPTLKYEELGDRKGMPNAAQLRKLDALFNTIPGWATINPQAAMRAFLKKRFRVEDIRFLDLRKYEIALKAVREIRTRRGLSND